MSQTDIIRQAYADLSSSDIPKQTAALATLGRLQVTDLVSDIVRLLPDDHVGQAAAAALVAVGTAAIRDDVELSEQPDFSAEHVASLHADDLVTVLRFNEQRDWVYIRASDSVEGWLWSALLSSPLPRVGAKPSESVRRDEAKAAEEADREPSRSIPDDLLELEDAEPPPQPVPAAPPTPPAAVAPVVPPPAPPQASQEVQFSAYYPKEVLPNVWLPLRAYFYRLSAAPQVLDDAREQLGKALDDYRRGSDTARADIQEGALVTATPELPGFQFNPPSVSQLFLEDWHRFDFKARATGVPLEQAANGRITFTVEGVIVADIPMSVFVSAAATPPDTSGSSPSLPASVASASTKPYQAVFCSYSHRDTQIVERVEKAYKALGLDFLRDSVMLKSGQNWNAELLNMIDRADIFQLFWSSNSSQSKYVRQEWEHALQRAAGREAFIRPVYWEDPMPNPPAELGHIHFAFQPELDD